VLYKIARKILKKNIKIEGSGPWNDTHFFVSEGIPTVTFGPEGKNAHASNEFVFIDSVIKFSKICVEAAKEFCSQNNV
jgi:acetylornithine deacetylase/succinyl-diaminopimelate desuccinylase-like protein